MALGTWQQLNILIQIQQDDQFTCTGWIINQIQLFYGRMVNKVFVLSNFVGLYGAFGCIESINLIQVALYNSIIVQYA